MSDDKPYVTVPSGSSITVNAEFMELVANGEAILTVNGTVDIIDTNDD